jgi:chromosome segregation ATPase
VDNKVEELTNIKSELKRNECLVNEQAQTIQSILVERDSLNFLIKKLTREKNDLECTQENLSQELNMSRDKLLAAEQCKDMLRAQLVVVTDELSESNKKLETHLKIVQEAIEREKKLESEKAQLAKVLCFCSRKYLT